MTEATAQNHLTHHVDDWGSPADDRDGIIAHLSAHPEHAWRYPRGYDFGDVTGLALAVAHRRHHEATPVKVAVLDTRYFRDTGLHLDFTQPGPWHLVSAGHAHGPEVVTTEEGPVTDETLRQLARAYPHVTTWQASPARVDETYRDYAAARRRLTQLLGVPEEAAHAILTIAATGELGWRFAYGRFEVTGDDDDQSFRIRTIPAGGQEAFVRDSFARLSRWPTRPDHRGVDRI